ncbi:MAG TPA: hypothetical protein VN193_12440 [Candidatus Angelobacter sp.]|nr:hypothetical protein [Candidatus Angelobacter sp.]
MSRAVRLAPIGLAALLAAALGSVTTALAFDKVDRLLPVQAGRGYVYYLDEVDASRQPLAGRSVTMKVGTVPGPGASVAASDAKGHPTGTPGASATAVSGSDGLAYFVLRTSTTPGDNQFTWSDTSWTGEVLIAGLPPAGATPSPTAAPTPTASPLSAAAGPGAGAGAAAGGGHGGPPASTRAPAHPRAAPAAARVAGGGAGFPPVLAGVLATAVVWLALPLTLMLARRRRAGLAAALASMAGPLPRAAAPPR